MKEYTRNLLVGTFVISGLACLGILMVWFGETPTWLGGDQWRLTIGPMHGIQGIGEGTPVQLNGVEIGRVSQLEFHNPDRPDRGVDVVCLIEDQYKIPRGSTAKLYGSTFGFGQGRVDVNAVPDAQAEPEPTDGTAMIHGEASSMLNEIVTDEVRESVNRLIDNLGNLAHEATPVARDIHNLLEERPVATVDAGRKPANLYTAIERFDRMGRHVNTVLGDANVQQDLKQVPRDLAETSGQLRDLVAQWRAETSRTADNVNDSVDHLEQSMIDTLQEVQSTVDKLDASAQRLTALMDAVRSSEGTIGLLIHDDRLYEAGVLTFDRLADLVGILQRVFGKVEQDGYITVGQETPVGTFKKNLPIEDGKIRASSSGE